MNTKHLSSIGAAVSLMLLVVAIEPTLLSPHLAQASSGILYVAPSGDCGGATPCYTSVQAAVDAAAVGDEIRVAAGTYTGINNLGGLAQMVYITKSLTIRGGYTTSNWTTPNPDANTTELQAQTLGRVVYVTGATTIVSLNGLHLTYGASNGLGGHSPTIFENYDAGGGLYVYQSRVTLDHCWLTNNAAGVGGGIYIREGTLNITATIINENEAGNGGGVYLYKSQSQIGSTSEFSLNRVAAPNPGGVAITAKNGTITLTDSAVTDNTVTLGGTAGAVYIDHAQFSIDNVEISGSIKSTGFSSFASDGTLQNSTINDNHGTGVSISNGTVTLFDNEIFNNASGVGIGGFLNTEVTLSDNFIHHNQGSSGAGVYVDAKIVSATLRHNIIQGNIAGNLSIFPPAYGNGGGVYILGDNATLEGNLIQNNTALGFEASGIYWGGHGGGVYIQGNPTLINNVVTGNAAVFRGSGIYISGSAPKLYHTTIANNSAGSGNDETGVYAAEKSSTEKAQPKLWNTIIANQATGIYAKGDVVANVVFVDGILWYGNSNNTAGTGTFFLSNEHTGDPLFVDLIGGDYHIGPGSAAIDNGVSTDVSTDIDGEPRFPGQVDLGADEYWAPGALKCIYLPLVVKN
jgi:hypothetical protein